MCATRSTAPVDRAGDVHVVHAGRPGGRSATILATFWTAFLLARRPITLVLMMINSCSYSTNDLVFNKCQIHDQDLSRCGASTKDLKSSFGATMV